MPMRGLIKRDDPKLMQASVAYTRCTLQN